MPERFTLHPSWPAATRGRIEAMARDDDLDYTMLGLKILEKYGPGYTSSDVGSEWLRGMPYETVYTAERVAYGNLVTGLVPPETAARRLRARVAGNLAPRPGRQADRRSRARKFRQERVSTAWNTSRAASESRRLM
jgi:hypothetical protein